MSAASPLFQPRAISTGTPALDAATGIAGLPRGRVVELFGPERAGKSTLALHTVAAAQRAGLVCAYVDDDNRFSTDYARAIGMDLAHLLVSQPESWAHALDIVEMVARSGTCDLVVLDSLERTRIKGFPGSAEHHRATHLANRFLRTVSAVIYRTGVTVLIVNRTSGGYGSPFGTGLKFYASMRLDVRRLDVEPPGPLRVVVAKNKHAAPFAYADLRIEPGMGLIPCAENFLALPP